MSTMSLEELREWLRTEPCPKCRVVGGLGVEMRLVSRPFGSFSLSGGQMKMSASEVPHIVCEHCDYIQAPSRG